MSSEMTLTEMLAGSKDSTQRVRILDKQLLVSGASPEVKIAAVDYYLGEYQDTLTRWKLRDLRLQYVREQEYERS